MARKQPIPIPGKRGRDAPLPSLDATLAEASSVLTSLDTILGPVPDIDIDYTDPTNYIPYRRFIGAFPSFTTFSDGDVKLSFIVPKEDYLAIVELATRYGEHNLLVDVLVPDFTKLDVWSGE